MKLTREHIDKRHDLITFISIVLGYRMNIFLRQEYDCHASFCPLCGFIKKWQSGFCVEQCIPKLHKQFEVDKYTELMYDVRFLDMLDLGLEI